MCNDDDRMGLRPGRAGRNNLAGSYLLASAVAGGEMSQVDNYCRMAVDDKVTTKLVPFVAEIAGLI